MAVWGSVKPLSERLKKSGKKVIKSVKKDIDFYIAIC